jgi:RNA polymerase sigma-70 factor (ECF subfamily)
MAPPSFDEVYRDCHRQVFALCRHVLGNPSDAQDALQETFLAVAQALPRFGGESSVKTWVHRIAIRVAIKLRARRPLHDELDHASDTGHDPTAQRAEADAVTRAMAGLSFEHRLVLSLFGVAGLSHGEIAETLGIPEGTVWSRLHHAKKQLAAALGNSTATSRALAADPARR